MMIENQIHRLFAEAVAAGPKLVVVELEPGFTAFERYEQSAPAVALPAGVPLALIVRSSPLSSPDVLRVVTADWRGNQAHLEVEIRHYTGALLGNEVTTCLIEFSLGPLKPGAYEATLTETRLEFASLEHPEAATAPTNSSYNLDFQVEEKGKEQ
jgi:hypothetical protein